jgi:recombination protein RecA
MNALMFGDKTDTPGGRAPKHYSSIRMQVARRAWIEIPNKDIRNSANTEKIGMIMKCKVIKSKVCNPMMESELPIIFDRGFVSFDDVQEIRKELMRKNKEK